MYNNEWRISELNYVLTANAICEKRTEHSILKRIKPIRWIKFRNPVILSFIHHRQYPLEFKLSFDRKQYAEFAQIFIFAQ
jgi:hypothetical protein